MTSLSVNPNSRKRLFQALDAIAQVSQGNATPTLDRIGAYQERRFTLAFRENRTPEGKQWPALAPSTKLQKRNPKPLVETVGRIPRSLFHEVKGSQAIVGYGDPLAILHHNGAKTGPRVIRSKNKKALYWQGARHPVKKVNHPGSVLPARGLVGFSARDQQEWEAIAFEDLRRLWDL